MPEHFVNVKSSDIHSTNVLPDLSRESEHSRSSSNISNSTSDICRICHCEADNGNPLISPCYCSGSLKYVHQSCLQQWLAASDIRSCELCKFNFILHTKIKPIGEWRRLEMSSVERRRLLCAILFHFVAAICVVWSLFVLIDRATEEVQKGLIAWPFWTKLVVVAVGFTGGAVFMYIQCRQYLHLFSRWKAHNRIILVQNAPEKPVVAPPSPNFTITLNPSTGCVQRSSQILANVECNAPPRFATISDNTLEPNYLFGDKVNMCTHCSSSTSSSFHKSSESLESHQEGGNNINENKAESLESTSFDALELNIQEVLALDIEFASRASKSSCLDTSSVDKGKNKHMFKSLPNLSASSENLLV